MRHMRRPVWKIAAYTASSGASGVWALTRKVSWGWAEIWRAHRWLVRGHRGRSKGRQQQTRHPGRGSVCCVSAALKGWCAVGSSRKPTGPCTGRIVRHCRKPADPALVELWDAVENQWTLRWTVRRCRKPTGPCAELWDAGVRGTGTPGLIWEQTQVSTLGCWLLLSRIWLSHCNARGVTWNTWYDLWAAFPDIPFQ